MLAATPDQPPVPSSTDNHLRWGFLPGCSAALAINKLAKTIDQPLLILCQDINLLQQLQHELYFFNRDNKLPILNFPDWETLIYDHFSPHDDLISQRLSTLYHLPSLTQGIVLTAATTSMQRLLPRDFLLQRAFIVERQQKFDIDQFRAQLINSGYQHVEQVWQHGEFAVRGSIIDIYPMGSSEPYRIELFDNEIESIRSFDPETQRSKQKVDRLHMLPAHEYPLDDDSIAYFRQRWREQFSGNPMDSPVYKSISQGEAAAGIEYYLPLFYKETQTLFDYLPQQTQIILVGDINDTANQFWQSVNDRHEQLRYDITRPICEPEQLLLTPDIYAQRINNFNKIQIGTQPSKNAHVNFAVAESPSLPVNSKLKRPLTALEEFINNRSSYRVLFCAESTGRRETLLDLLKTIAVMPKLFNTWQEFADSEQRFGITVSNIDRGLLLEEKQLAIITESQLFGEQVQQRRLRKQRQLDPNLMIRNLTELSVGSPVVHIDHGVGRYQGLQTITTGDVAAEYLTLQYAGDDKIYVPVANLHLISRYTGADAEHAPITRLGSKQWEKTKQKASKRVRDVAAELLEIYSQRQATPGFQFAKPNDDYWSFKNSFPFEETPDQKQAIDAVIDDMNSKHSMDRLVCGDVGFGKTEVAMQAAFLATQSNKQVAMLVPTTLLARQHFENFKDRFADWPIKIESLSRMKTAKQSQQIIADLAAGKVDIVIGTHKLLSENISFADLGLLIVDEEHRFGVRQKERIKALRAHVDILTLTATPIPRTLNMAMAGTRDLSIIATPPAKRLAVKTFISETKPALIREAIMRETMRGGQVYFLHNDVATIEATREKLQDIVPQADIQIGHGQMRERQLEQVMSDFYHQRFNVLLCTTIIESGIDVPTANTIIINRADKFGLAQLHQIRGRVGRSHHQAYAYLLTPPKSALTSDAKKRLEAIGTMEDLGAGFYLATHDLEIRGAGELLGEEQSGHIEAVGFTLYMELLDDAVKSLKAGKEPDFEKSIQPGCDIDMHISALIPDDYVHDVHTRLTLYKRLSSCVSDTEIQDIKAELVDRFGLLPAPAENLIEINKLRLLASPLGIKKIEVGKEFGYIHFNEKPNVDPSKIIQLIQTQSKRFQLHGSDKLRFKMTDEESQQRFKTTQHVLSLLS